MAKNGVDRREHAGAARLQAVERAGGGEAFQHAFVDGARIDAAGEVGNVLERLVVARGENAVDRLAADAAQRRERIVNGAALDVELDAGAVDRRRLDLDAEPLGLGAEFGELVGVAHVERHRGGEELDRIIRLHVGGLIGDQRIGRGVALVEAVIGEALQQFEDRLRLARLDAARDRAGDEAGALRLHFAADFLAHGAAQQVGLAERIAGQDLRRLHHLFLIDDDAVGLAQDRLELGMDVFGRFEPLLARAIGRDVRHRPRPVERDQRDDVLEAVGAHVDQRAAHPRAFHLEHADGVAAGQHLVGFLRRRAAGWTDRPRPRAGAPA